jgi:hypothetical protein
MHHSNKCTAQLTPQRHQTKSNQIAPNRMLQKPEQGPKRPARMTRTNTSSEQVLLLGEEWQNQISQSEVETPLQG